MKWWNGVYLLHTTLFIKVVTVSFYSFSLLSVKIFESSIPKISMFWSWKFAIHLNITIMMNLVVCHCFISTIPFIRKLRLSFSYMYFSPVNHHFLLKPYIGFQSYGRFFQLGFHRSNLVTKKRTQNGSRLGCGHSHVWWYSHVDYWGSCINACWKGVVLEPAFCLLFIS